MLKSVIINFVTDFFILLQKINNTMTITNHNGKWLINGKRYIDCNYEEKKLFIKFIMSFKYE